MDDKTQFDTQPTETRSNEFSRSIKGKSLKKSPISSYEQEGGLDLNLFFETIRRRFLLITGVTTLFTAVTFVWSTTRPPNYISQFQILVEPITAESEVVASVTGQDTAVSGQDLGATQNSRSVLDYPTQIEILLSRQLIEPVIQELSGQFPHLEYSQLRDTLQINRVSARGTKETTKILQVVYQSSTPEETQQILKILSQTYLNYSLSERQTNLNRAIQFTNRQLPVFTSRVRNLEETIQKFREDNQILEPGKTTEQISQQLASIKNQLATTQIELSKERQLYASLERQVQLQPNSAEAGSVLSEAPEYRTLVEQLQTVETQLEVGLGELSEQHPAILDLKERRDRLRPLVNTIAQKVLGEKLTKTVANSDEIPFQTSLRRKLGQQLIETSVDLSVLEVENQKLLEAKRSLEQQVLTLPKLTREYDALQSQLNIASNNLEQFLETREELLINSARQEVPWELIEPPQEASAAILTSLPRDISLGAMLGCLMGIGIAIMLDRNINVIHSVQQLREQGNSPILGAIPVEKGLETVAFSTESEKHSIFRTSQGVEAQNELLSQEETFQYRFSAFLETFKSLQLQLRLLNPDEPISSLVVSSATPSEGKTTVSLHLAQAAASLGQKVLLIDADLRLSRIQECFNLEKNAGLVDYLVTNGQNIEDFIQKLPGEENLSILLAGTQATDSTKVLASQRMSSLMESLNACYDLIIYDTPPLGIADPAIVASQTDGLLLVTKMGSVKQSLLKEILHNLELASIPLLGIVANGVKTNQMPYNYYGKYGLDEE